VAIGNSTDRKNYALTNKERVENITEVVSSSPKASYARKVIKTATP